MSNAIPHISKISDEKQWIDFPIIRGRHTRHVAEVSLSRLANRRTPGDSEHLQDLGNEEKLLGRCVSASVGSLCCKVHHRTGVGMQHILEFGLRSLG